MTKVARIVGVCLLRTRKFWLSDVHNMRLIDSSPDYRQYQIHMSSCMNVQPRTHQLAQLAWTAAVIIWTFLPVEVLGTNHNWFTQNGAAPCTITQSYKRHQQDTACLPSPYNSGQPNNIFLVRVFLSIGKCSVQLPASAIVLMYGYINVEERILWQIRWLSIHYLVELY